MKILCFEITYVGFTKNKSVSKFVKKELARSCDFVHTVKVVKNQYGMLLMEAKKAVEDCIKKDQKLLQYVSKETQERLRR